MEGETQNSSTFSISFKELVELINFRFYWGALYGVQHEVYVKGSRELIEQL